MAKKKPVSKKTPASRKKTAGKKAPAKKAAVKKKPVKKKPAAKKAPAKKAARKKTAAKKTPAKKAPAKKAASQKTAPKKKPAKKTPAKKPPVKKAVAKKAPAKKPAAKKSPTRKPEPPAPAVPPKKKSSRVKPPTIKSPVKKKPARKPVVSGRPAKTAFKPPTQPIVPQAPAVEKPSIGYDGPELTTAELRKIKTALTKKQIAALRAELLDRRRELLGNLVGLEESHKASSGDLSNMPVHMADVGSDAFDREFTLGLMESERTRITHIDAALERIEDGAYGVCVISGKPIEHARLEYVPWTRYCVEVARARERHGLK
ncbi:MAG: TraR/DksA C4-type zinc finger protein [Planctomycetota bacterium]